MSEGQMELLSHLDTRRIYVENVRSLLGVSQREALAILETAVRQGVFKKKVEVVCPDGTVAASAENEGGLPPVVHCWAEDDEGFPEETELITQNLKKVVFYSLDDTTSSAHYSATS